jgi:predicted secreted protein
MYPVRSGRWVQPLRWLLLILIAMVCHSQAAFAATTVVTDDDKGGTVQLKLGDTLELHLKSNPSTGYAWLVHPRSTMALRLANQAQNAATEPDPDRPVTQVFIFEVKRKGDGILLMRYARAKEKPAIGQEQFTLHVVIE